MFELGWASRSIVPDRPAMLFGQKHTRVARQAMDPLTITALALRRGSTRVVMLSADILLFPEAHHADVQRRVAEAIPALAPDDVFAAATHTHTSLTNQEGVYPQPKGDVMTPTACADFVAARAAEAAAQAWGQLSPGGVARAYGHAVVAHNRRPQYADGGSRMYGRAADASFRGLEGPADHSLDMVFTFDPAGGLTGMILNVPCPSQVDEGLEVYSADFWHDVRVEIRRRRGEHLHFLAFCGAAGDVSPHFILDGRVEEEMRRRRGLSERQVIACKIANAVDEALACTPAPAGGAAAATPLEHRVHRVELSPRRISLAERDLAAKLYEQEIKSVDPASWWPTCLRQVVENYPRQDRIARVPVEIHAVRLGDAGIVTNPFELFTDFGRRIRARSPAGQTLVVQLAAGAGWYLPTQRGVEGGSYGAIPPSCKAGPEGGQELVEHSLAALAQLFPAQG